MKQERRKTIELQELAVDRLAAQLVHGCDPHRVAHLLQMFGQPFDDADKIVSRALRRQLERASKEFRAAVVDEASAIARESAEMRQLQVQS